MNQSDWKSESFSRHWGRLDGLNLWLQSSRTTGPEKKKILHCTEVRTLYNIRKNQIFVLKKRRQTKKSPRKIHTDIWQKKEIILSAIIKKCVFKTEFLKKEKKKFNHHLELGENFFFMTKEKFLTFFIFVASVLSMGIVLKSVLKDNNSRFWS